MHAACEEEMVEMGGESKAEWRRGAADDGMAELRARAGGTKARE